MQKEQRGIRRENWFLRIFKKISIIKYIFLIYILITILISLFLFWPITHSQYLKEHMSMGKIKFNYSDAFFIAASAFSDTGLSTIPIGLCFNQFGQALIAISMLLGGFGIFTLKIYVLQTIFGTKLSVFDSQITQVERGSHNIGQTKKIIKISITTLLITLLITSFIFTIIFYTSPYGKFDNQEALKPYNPFIFNPYEEMSQNPKGDFQKSLRYGIFHAISSLNNAGFDIIGQKSLAPYNEEYALQIFTLLSIFIGGIGYPVIYDIYRKIKSFSKHETTYRITLFTKLTLVTYLIVTAIGLLFTFTFELSSKNEHSFWKQQSYGNNWAKTFAIYFQTKSTRSAGFATIDYYHFTKQSLVIHSILMFIGFSPASTAGGIRNITVSILFLSAISMILGRKSVFAFKRQIGKQTLIKAINIFTIGIIIVILGTLLGASAANLNEGFDDSQKQFNMLHILFEICSAFGSSGLSTGITPNMNAWGKLILIICMIIGQLGIQQTILIWGNNRKKTEYYQYIYEDVAIG